MLETVAQYMAQKGWTNYRVVKHTHNMVWVTHGRTELYIYVEDNRVVDVIVD